ncbi:hypothetical protein HB364_01350 [Pseudoflavitalea sp. X16]|uniref:hypothetical protein n=1 Tax=Paraflavitalea devenefica TaxID=2716334 RepID=UPI001423F54C|nr:hypothetical protein [Paraflavitalea devenefica]NII23707.1 hypothetical protein [Paraflavitalea devenefica]
MAIHHSILRRSLSGILLVLFAFSITPKKTLHDWIVSHTDGVSTTKSDAAQVTKAGFNCNHQNLVAESPFTADSQYIDLTLSRAYAILSAALSSRVYATDLFFHSLRGPPAIS